MDKNQFVEQLKKVNISISDLQLNQLNRYYELLIEWNQKINLTGITKKEEVYLKHFYDSLTIIKMIDLNNIKTLCDIGTGAGFPGLVIKILYPDLNITLVDSLNKRIQFLNLVIEELKLKKIVTFHERAEEFSKNNIQKFDVITARAVSHLSIILELSVSAIKINGYFIAMKSNVEQELSESKNCFKELKLKLIKKEEFELPIENSKRVLLKIQKKAPTSKKYPRKYSEIKKNKL